jgi:hypothetical protein
MTSQAFPLAALVVAHDADPSRVAAIAAMVATSRDLGAVPIVVAAPPTIELPVTARVVRTREAGSRINAIRLGMAQLANTPARVVLLWPHDAPTPSLVHLLSMADAAKRAPDAIVALDGALLDGSPIFVPRDAWLELVTLGESGLDALAARRRVERVAVAPD